VPEDPTATLNQLQQSQHLKKPNQRAAESSPSMNGKAASKTKAQ